MRECQQTVPQDTSWSFQRALCLHSLLQKSLVLRCCLPEPHQGALQSNPAGMRSRGPSAPLCQHSLPSCVTQRPCCAIRRCLKGPLLPGHAGSDDSETWAHSTCCAAPQGQGGGTGKAGTGRRHRQGCEPLPASRACPGALGTCWCVTHPGCLGHFTAPTTPWLRAQGDLGDQMLLIEDAPSPAQGTRLVCCPGVKSDKVSASRGRGRSKGHEVGWSAGTPAGMHVASPCLYEGSACSPAMTSAW